MECLKLGGTQGKWVSKHMYLKSLSDSFWSLASCGVGKLFDEATSIYVGSNIYGVHPNKCCSVN